MPPPEKPRTNEDFRKLLATPRVDRFAEATPARGQSRQASQKQKKPYRPKPKPETEEADDGRTYRSGAHCWLTSRLGSANSVPAVC